MHKIKNIKEHEIKTIRSLNDAIKETERRTIAEAILLSGGNKKEAMKKAAEDRGISKRDVYNKLIGK